MESVFKIEPTNFNGLYKVFINEWEDSRGWFKEIYSLSKFIINGKQIIFRQDNESKSKKDVIRGLHFQRPPFGQGKLIQVINGSVLDVSVDIRKNSRTYGQHYLIKLSSKDNFLFYISEGFGHGFKALEDGTIFYYKCTNQYKKEAEVCINFDDPDLNINWGIGNHNLSEKDKQGISFGKFDTPF